MDMWRKPRRTNTVITPPPISKLKAGPYAAFRIVPHSIRMAVYTQAKPGKYTDVFDSIESFDLELV